MSISSVVTEGYGPGASIALVVTSGYGGGAAPPEDVALLSGGSYQGLRKRFADEDRDRNNRWRKRRKQLETISNLIDGITEEIPADVPEAQVARAAVKAIEKAADKLAEDVPLPAFDWRGLARDVAAAQAALAQAERAFAAYQARVEDEDDEDALLLMA